MTRDQANDRVQLYDILTRAGVQGRDAHVFTQLVEEMASENLIRRFESKLEAQNATINTLKWMVGLGFTALGILVAVLALVA